MPGDCRVVRPDRRPGQPQRDADIRGGVDGVDEHDVPRVISAQQLKNALQKVYDLIDAADLSMCQEIDLFGNKRTEENREIIASALNIILPETHPDDRTR